MPSENPLVLTSSPERRLNAITPLHYLMLGFRRLYHQWLMRGPSANEANRFLRDLPEKIPGGRVAKFPVQNAKHVAVIIRQAHLVSTGNPDEPGSATHIDREHPINPLVRIVQQDIETIIRYFAETFNVKEVFSEGAMMGDERLNYLLGMAVSKLEADLVLLREAEALLFGILQKSGSTTKAKRVFAIVSQISSAHPLENWRSVLRYVDELLSAIQLSIQQKEDSLREMKFMLDHDAVSRLAKEGVIKLRPSKTRATMQIQNHIERSFAREDDALRLMQQHMDTGEAPGISLLTMGAAHDMEAARDRNRAPLSLAIVTPDSYRDTDFAHYIALLRSHFAQH